jgi:GT2 family glycosyltransferase
MIKLSIIIVNYKADENVKRLLSSIPKHRAYEAIIVDNTIHNRGFSKACNEGVVKAKGTYLLFLNPDCVILPGAIELMLKKIEKEPTIGILGPQLLDASKKPYLSFSKQPSKRAAPIYLSFMNKIFPNNKYSIDYEYRNYSLNEENQVENISGAAMMMRKTVFEKVGGFDERFFLYWEDFDLSKRVASAGYSVLYFPKAKIIHEGGQSSKQDQGLARQAFRSSRFTFFKKYYGMVYALFLETWLTLFEEWRFVLIIILAAFLRFDRLPELMPLIGDQGRDLLAALSAWQSKTLPLLGIPSSIPRFHQGPLSIWFFAAVFGLFGIDPVYAGYFSAMVGLLAVAGTYLLVERHYGRLAA